MFDPVIVYLLILLLPAITLSLLLVVAAAVAVWSRNPERRATARGLLRLLVHSMHSRG